MPQVPPMPRMPVTQTWSSAPDRRIGVGKQHRRGVPPLRTRSIRRYTSGSLYPTDASAARTIASVSGGPVNSSESFQKSSTPHPHLPGPFGHDTSSTRGEPHRPTSDGLLQVGGAGPIDVHHQGDLVSIEQVE